MLGSAELTVLTPIGGLLYFSSSPWRVLPVGCWLCSGRCRSRKGDRGKESSQTCQVVKKCSILYIDFFFLHFFLRNLNFKPSGRDAI